MRAPTSAGLVLGFFFAAGVFGCSSSNEATDGTDGGGDDTSLGGDAGDAGATDTSAASDVGDDGDAIDTDARDGTTTDGGDAGCTSFTLPDTTAADRTACKFGKGARVADTLGIDAALRAKIPITHVVVVMQENRPFDHYFGTLSTHGQPDAEGWPAGYTLLDAKGAKVAPYRLAKTCLPSDLPHDWTSMHADWNGGKMDGFIKSAATSTSDGHDAVGMYEQPDLPFYTWLASTYAISDRYFADVIGPTWPNRLYLYAGTSGGVKNTGGATLPTGTPSIFDAMDAAKVAWGVYTDGTPRQDSMGWTKGHAGVHTMKTFFDALAAGTLPPVAFVDPSGANQDEHPPNDVQKGEAWSRTIYLAATSSPLWKSLVVFHTYDEGGGLADHVAPPKACLAAPSESEFDHFGFRVPIIAISPWAKPHHVSHQSHAHSSILRFIELLHDLPALTGRDANADALLDLFDFGCAMPGAGTPPAAGTGGC